MLTQQLFLLLRTRSGTRRLISLQRATISFALENRAMKPRGVFFGRHRRFYRDDPHSKTTTATTVATAAAALDLLDLQERGRTAKDSITARELRTAYYRAAKECHPDSPSNKKKKKFKDEDASERFRRVTEAYELLQQQSKSGEDDQFIDDDSFVEQQQSEADYRAACLEWLGQPAEVVEESKRCPAFRQWLSGRTDAAHYWNNFFMLHGGLAPRLLPRQLGMKSSKANAAATTVPTLEQRPRRKRRR